MLLGCQLVIALMHEHSTTDVVLLLLLLRLFFKVHVSRVTNWVIHSVSGCAGVLLGYQLAIALMHEHSTADVELLLRWHSHAGGDGTPLHVAILVINDMVHRSPSHVRLRYADQLDPFKARLLPLLIPGVHLVPAAVTLDYNVV